MSEKEKCSLCGSETDYMAYRSAKSGVCICYGCMVPILKVYQEMGFVKVNWKKLMEA